MSRYNPLSETKVSPELQAKLEELRLAGVVQKIRVMVEFTAVPMVTQLHVLTVDYKAEIAYQSGVSLYISIIVDSDKVTQIVALPWVKRVWHVPTVQLLAYGLPIIPTPYPVPAGYWEVTLMESAKHIGVDRAKIAGYTGKAIKIAVVDSGVEKTHPMLQGKVIAEKNFIGSDPGDRLGHGTWCASCVLGNYWVSSVGPLEGMAPSAMLINAKGFETGSSTIDILMAALEWGCEQGAQISSNSWGGGGTYPPLRDLIIRLKATYRTIFVFAAGNSGPDYGTVDYAGGYPEVIGVGSIAVKNPSPNTVADFSSRGPNFEGAIKPDIMAPGGNGRGGYDECIYAAGLGGTVKCNRGTSMATPHIAGGLALLLEAGLTTDKLYATARDLLELGKDNDSGFGTADFASALGLPVPVPYALSLGSTPIQGVKIYVDGEVHLTPWSGEVSEGLHIISALSKCYVNGVPYRFLKWEDGSTNSTRTINIVSDISIIAYYQEIPIYSVTFTSNPVTGIAFGVDQKVYTTPYSGMFEEGTYTLEMPSRAVVNGATYDFVRWEDGSTEPTRIVEVTGDTTLIAYYKLIPAYLLFVDSKPAGIRFTIDETYRVTPWIGKVLEGKHVISMPSENFKVWEDISTSPTRTINLTSAMSIIAYYSAHILTINTTPMIGVHVTLNENPIGNTPISVIAGEGTHTISVPQELEA